MQSNPEKAKVSCQGKKVGGWGKSIDERRVTRGTKENQTIKKTR
jgi:hypothetical protein